MYSQETSLKDSYQGSDVTKMTRHLEIGLSEDFYLYQNKNIKTKTKHIALFFHIYNNWQM